MRAFAWVIVLCHVCFAQTVRVRVINGLDARPLPKPAVVVQLLYEHPAKISSPLRIETDANGEAQFSIPESFPNRIDVHVALTSEYWHCACWVMSKTEEVLHKGIMQVPRTSVPNAPFPPANTEPGQIVFVARPFTDFERLLYPVIKRLDNW